MANPILPSERPDPRLPGGIPIFFVAIGALALLRIGLGYVSFPLAWLPVADAVLAVLFLTVPVVALFFAANDAWTGRSATLFTVGGILVQAAAILIGTYLPIALWGQGALGAIAQAALTCWCVGLGALLATLIKEKNILLPIAIFLAAYDFFLVLTPWGFTQKLLKVAQPVFTKVAAQIPAASATPTHGLAHPSAFVGMADLVFLAMFFIALFRFRMRTRQTLYAVVPALLVYLAIVVLAHGHRFLGFPLDALPALVPIGIAVLAVNWREFQLTREEKTSTAVLAILAIGFLIFAATRPRPPAGPARPGLDRATSGSAGSPGPVSRDPRR